MLVPLSARMLKLATKAPPPPPPLETPPVMAEAVSETLGTEATHSAPPSPAADAFCTMDELSAKEAAAATAMAPPLPAKLCEFANADEATRTARP